MRLKQLDIISLLLIGFGLIFAFMYFYLVKIDNSIKEYSSYHDNITELKILDKEFNNFLLHKLTFANYDSITDKTRQFSNIMDALHRSDISKHFGEEFTEELTSIERLYHCKLDSIEFFKSSNASAINSLNYLFDLNKVIMKDPAVSKSTAELTNKILFLLMQTFTQVDSDSRPIEQSLQMLSALSQSDENTDLFFFNKHTNVTRKSLSILNQLSVSTDNTALFGALHKFQNNLEQIYKEHLSTQKTITSLFFLSAFVILVILIIMHRLSLHSKEELQAFKLAVEHSDNSVIITSPDRKIVYVNDVFERDSGYSREEVLGKNPRILKSEILDQQFYDEMNDKLDRGLKWEGEFINRRKNGSLYYENASIVPIFLNNKLINYLAIKLDVTKYVLQHQQLEQSAAVFDNTEDAIMITDKENRIISVNKAFKKMMGYHEQEILGKNPKFLKSGKQDAYFYQSMWNAVMSTDVWKGKIYDKTKDGSIIPTWLTIKAIKNKKGQIDSFISIYTDLQDIIKTQERANFLAFHDSLTGLPNRINFEERLAHVLQIANRKNKSIAVLFIDLDRFKVINDTLGHQVGDEMLKSVALRIKHVLRNTDMLARIGGDEFVVILESLTQQSDSANISKKILETVKKPIKVGNALLNTTASIGIALYPDDGQDCNTIIKHADSAMYHAKDLGKNNYQYYTEKLSRAMHKHLDIEQALQTALADDEFFLVYQPQYNLQTRKIIGVEALLRWQSKTLGFIPPAEFIPVAEDNGMITKIGEFVFETSCKAFRKFKDTASNLNTISINISSLQFREDKLLENLLSVTLQTGVSPQNIELEITERYIMEYTSTSMTILEDLRNLGFKISIDDFGTGYSSMSYLKKLPLDRIKIDKSFIDDIPDDNNDVEITKAIIALSKSLGYSVIAEGVEKEEQEHFLREHNCDIAQGYYFSKSLTDSEFIEFCKQHGESCS